MKPKRLQILVYTIFYTTILSVGAQTNQPTPVITTNFITADSSFRIVNGQLYNTEKSYLWVDLTADYVENRDDGTLLVFRFENKPVYETQRRSSDSLTSSGNFLGSGSGGPIGPRQAGTRREDMGEIVLTNYSKTATVNQVVRVRAMITGTKTIGNRNYELWDCGTPNIVRVVRTNWIAPPQPTASHQPRS